VLMDLDGSTAEYAVRYWLTDLAADDPTDSAVRERLFAAFRRAGLHFAFGEQVVHVVQGGEAEAERARSAATSSSAWASCGGWSCSPG
jgi:small-conductance mechanosensitive channel